MKRELLRLENITKIYSNGFVANRDVSMSVRGGEIHALLGENGAGKTTLMKVLFGLEDYQGGRIVIEEEEVQISNPLDAIAKGVGMVHQHFMLVDGLTVAENIILGMEPGRLGAFDAKLAIQMTEDVSEKYDLAVDPHALVRDISVGLKQKVELLKALIRGVRVLILDEPTAVLTPQETRELFHQLRILRSHGYGIIFISHKLQEVMELCDTVTILRRGRVVGSGDIKDFDEQKLSRMIVGREVIKTVERSEPKRGDVVLSASDATFVDDIGKIHVSGLNFAVRSGEIVGIVGIEGNGQTQLSEIITGLLPITSGDIHVNGRSINGLNIDQIRKLGLAHITEDRLNYGCAPDLTIYENLAAIYLSSNRFSNGPLINKRALNSYVDACIEEFEIACDSRNTLVWLLSGGNIQKVIVAREFTCGANLIIANQPTRGIDVGTASLIHRLLHQYTREKGFAVLLISSDLNEVLNYSDRLFVMRQGRFNAHFTDVANLTDETLGEYMLGVRSMTEEEMGNVS